MEWLRQTVNTSGPAVTSDSQATLRRIVGIFRPDDRIPACAARSVVSSLTTRETSLRLVISYMGISWEFSDDSSRSALWRYGAALTGVLLALATRWLLSPLLHDSLPYLTLFPALMFSALYCGTLPSVAAAAAGLLGADLLFVAPTHPPFADTLTGAVIFLAAASLVLALGEGHRRRREHLWTIRKGLEQRVEDRTAELDSANQSLGDLTGRLLHLQDEERRRIARELHDSVGQSLAALSMNLSSLEADFDRLRKTGERLSDSASLVKGVSTEIRTISHLLHPPLLDEAGLAFALRWYIEGFSERSKIHVALELPEEIGRLPRDLETAIFRLVQECLTNVHRHSGSPGATVRIVRETEGVLLEVRDRGKGIPSEKEEELMSGGTPGVGIRGMRERVRQLGGSLQVNSDGAGRGTRILAKIPVPQERTDAARSAGAGHG